eukprot:3169252-Pyramimonas_sp.AAC.1
MGHFLRLGALLERMSEAVWGGPVGTSSAVEDASEPFLGPPGAHVELGGLSERSRSALEAVFGVLLGRLGRPPA